MAYNILETQVSVNMAEQALQQRQIPFDIIFDQQRDNFGNYYVLVLANQESLDEKMVVKIKEYVKNGGGIVATGKTGMYDGWRRLREKNLLEEMLSETGLEQSRGPEKISTYRRRESIAFNYGEGRVVYLPELIIPEGEIKLGFESVWMMPKNANELTSAVYWAAGKTLPLTVTGPEWIGISHDTQDKREVIHIFNYHIESDVIGITLKYNGAVKKAWVIILDQDERIVLPVTKEGEQTIVRISSLKVYKIIVLEKL
jgi:beta-galactosidase GanA